MAPLVSLLNDRNYRHDPEGGSPQQAPRIISPMKMAINQPIVKSL